MQSIPGSEQNRVLNIHLCSAASSDSPGRTWLGAQGFASLPKLPALSMPHGKWATHRGVGFHLMDKALKRYFIIIIFFSLTGHRHYDLWESKLLHPVKCCSHESTRMLMTSNYKLKLPQVKWEGWGSFDDSCVCFTSGDNPDSAAGGVKGLFIWISIH